MQMGGPRTAHSNHKSGPLIADSNAAYHPLAPAIDNNAPTDVTVRSFVIDGRRDGNADTGEEAVMMMVMVVMVVLNKVQERFGLLGACKIICDQGRSCIWNRVEKINI
jgi:hypothetical protein